MEDLSQFAEHTVKKEESIACDCAPAEVKADAKVMLFATPTCPNCKAAATFLDKAGLPYEKLMANEHADLVEKYGIRQAPTLVTSSGEKIVNLSNIKAYTERK